MMEAPEGSERDILYADLIELINRFGDYNAIPENRARCLSLTITNIEQGAHWLREHIAYDPLPASDTPEDV